MLGERLLNINLNINYSVIWVRKRTAKAGTGTQWWTFRQACLQLCPVYNSMWWLSNLDYQACTDLLSRTLSHMSAISDSESTQSKSPARILGILGSRWFRITFWKNYLLQAGLLGAYADTKLTNFQILRTSLRQHCHLTRVFEQNCSSTTLPFSRARIRWSPFWNLTCTWYAYLVKNDVSSLFTQCFNYFHTLIFGT